MTELVGNRLTQETSPYLLQHADNPVHWQPWDDAALALAEQSGKPILLSVGYSSCHWCHVMAHESFEDDATAEVMNEHFVCIKVDREERPDLDKVYQLAHYLLTRSSGGWPLTIFLDPETRVPFFSGTYFPKRAMYQRPSFVDLLLRISQAFAQQGSEIGEQGERLVELLQSTAARESEDQAATSDEIADLRIFSKAFKELRQSYDEQHGGFGSAPKFPMPTSLDLLLRYSDVADPREGTRQMALDMALTTLTKICRGGIRDHLGGGFCRYSVDQEWMIPHFEKMLYDNGALLSVLSDACAIDPDSLYRESIEEAADWMIREMQSQDGAFFSSIDADSEGEEGRFYLWRRNTVRKLLSEEEFLVFATLYGIDKQPNFEGRAWNPHRYDSWRSVVFRLDMEPGKAAELLASAKQKLFDARELRVRPARDDKVLASWNGLAIKGLVCAGAALDMPEYMDAAEQAVDFVRSRMIDQETGRLYATHAADRSRFLGYLDDYANLIEALLHLLQHRWRDDLLVFVQDLAERVLAEFEDTDEGGFYFTSTEHEALIHTPKPAIDEAVPAGNGVLCSALLKLSELVHAPEYREAAERILRWATPDMERMPSAHASLLGALHLFGSGLETCVIRGEAGDTAEWQAVCRQGYAPRRQCFSIPWECAGPDWLPHDASGAPLAYLCENFSCSVPIRDMNTLRSALKG
ncbi:MAG: thioredoxin domain-containing protein [Gammaproteobacteria bacterium]|nr:thioredoxin domain-containing protein [Gammaproteobacteria bacterium]